MSDMSDAVIAYRQGGQAWKDYKEEHTGCGGSGSGPYDDSNTDEYHGSDDMYTGD